VVAYVELHIEQGPVLERAGIPVGVVDGVVGARRGRIIFEGRAAHAGTTPMELRHDPVAAAARLALAARTAAIAHRGVATVGAIRATPGIATAVAEQVTMTLDLRHRDRVTLETLAGEARAAMEAIAAEERTPATWSALQAVDPVVFDPGLVTLAEDSVRAVAGACLRLPSGALHDAVMVARAGTPAVMLFVQSIGGLSHNRDEDSDEGHLALGIAAFDDLIGRIIGSR
jgi:N-carbamoyl-L-amino-acid hydrolase